MKNRKTYRNKNIIFDLIKIFLPNEKVEKYGSKSLEQERIETVLPYIKGIAVDIA